jgi:hypothetical protein
MARPRPPTTYIGAHSSSLMKNPTEPWKFLANDFGSTERKRSELGQMRTKNPVSDAVSIGSGWFIESPISQRYW